MSLFDRFRRKPETRASQPPIYGALNWGARYVNPTLAENLCAVAAAVDCIASAAASLPAFVYRTTDAGRAIDATHPLAGLIRSGPNARQTWADWVQWTFAQALLNGNAVSEIVSDNRGRVIGLTPIPFNYVSVVLLPSGRLAFDVVAYRAPFGGSGSPRRLLDSEVLHLRDRSDDGLIGRSRLSRVAPVISTALDQQAFAGALYANGIMPSGALKLDAKIDSDQAARMRSQLDQAYGAAADKHKTLILQPGMDFVALASTPQEAELLSSRKFTTEEVARIFNVPPPLLQDYSHNTFTNSAAAGRWFAQFTLAPWLRKLEAEFARSVFSTAQQRTHCLEFDMSAFLRGDDAARWAAWKIALDAGVLTADEVRLEEGFGPRADTTAGDMNNGGGTDA